ncbi:GntR family transcriptional regulator [Rhodococcus sp. NPDC076796]|uniref:GntR family transcriptional regulator n=1 Tax=Rhodococcus sp. NPDC076796 TaxID=3154859 RepID=UPI00344E4D0E
MSTQSSRKVTARERAYRELRLRIVSLTLAPGSPLSENELAEQMSVSRTPVRESLILLAEEGLVQVFPQLGTFVSRVDTERVADAQFVREAIETASLSDAVNSRSNEDLAALRANLAAQAEPGIDMDQFFELDEQFHQLLLAAGGHSAAWRSVESAKAHLDRARRLGLRDTRPIPDLIAQHTAIVNGLEARDFEAAARSMREHLRAVFADVEYIKSKSPHLFSNSNERPTRKVVSSWE